MVVYTVVPVVGLRRVIHRVGLESGLTGHPASAPMSLGSPSSHRPLPPRAASPSSPSSPSSATDGYETSSGAVGKKHSKEDEYRPTGTVTGTSVATCCTLLHVVAPCCTLLHVVACCTLLHVARCCLLHVVACCTLHVARCTLHVARCTLHVARSHIWCYLVYSFSTGKDEAPRSRWAVWARCESSVGSWEQVELIPLPSTKQYHRLVNI